MENKTQPDFEGNGVVVWKKVTKNGKPYVTVKILDSIYVNCWLKEQKPQTTTPQPEQNTPAW